MKFGGKIDGVVINHGALEPLESVANSTIGEWKKLYDINFFSALALVRANFPNKLLLAHSHLPGPSCHSTTTPNQGTPNIYHIWRSSQGLSGVGGIRIVQGSLAFFNSTRRGRREGYR